LPRNWNGRYELQEDVNAAQGDVVDRIGRK